ncbi:MAG: cobinamide kinase [Clostridium sp.]|nr:cobinamide kinase [Clostridium sp.]
MKFVIGGEFQGKLEFALNLVGAKEEEALDLAKESFEELKGKKIIYNLNLFIKKLLTEGKEQEEIEDIISNIINENPEIIIVTTEIGYGIVPMDKFDRNYREVTGRICCGIAKKANKVYRVVCGIGNLIKGED